MNARDSYATQLNSAIDYAIQHGTFNPLNVINSASDVILFGVGRYFEEAFERQNVRERFNVTYLCDNNPEKHGKFYNGLKCLSPADAMSLVKRERERDAARQ